MLGCIGGFWVLLLRLRFGRDLVGSVEIGLDDAVNLTSEKHDPNAQMNHLQKEENKKTLQNAPV